MKNKIILGIILIGIMFMLTGCSVSNYYGETKEFKDETNDRFITIKEWQDSHWYKFIIRYDKETNVEYLFAYYDNRISGITPLLNADGTPLLYGGE